ncbi:hypothetical protein [Variovorax ginsengisoli]|uniref:DUF2188 domain-containing protein n=1 Tax=Variovorax ginsengisoli TaxID=363844 RepID=A0ABT8RZ16_9BURK|nr:hypothetical protein [Variovorax ginsengisoli]MDN8612741.1 hypothetical protein [Variovorax ginsengisoli]MDO1531911.1 hypothetical protein [Variovorax ginsengisoli]
MTRLLQDETQTHDSKGPWFASRADARRVAREAAAEITDAQIRDQDSLFGCPEEPRK